MIKEAASMRSALQAASGNEKILSERETELTALKTQLADLTTVKEDASRLQSKVTTLETEIETVSLCFKHKRWENTDPYSSRPPLRRKRRNPGLLRPLTSMSRRRSEGSNTLSRNCRLRMRSSRKNTIVFRRNPFCSKRYVGHALTPG